MPKLEVFPDVRALSEAAAERFVAFAQEAIRERGRFNVALSGGSTPKRLHALLAAPPLTDGIDWPRVHVFWGDERYVPATDPNSNEGMARLTLLSSVGVPETQIFPMYSEGGPAAAAAAYEAIVRHEVPDLKFDLVLLGIGPDGHTASLFPGQPGVHEAGRLVIPAVGAPPVTDRITMTPPLLTLARHILFLIAGEDKAEAMTRLLKGADDFDHTPSQAIARGAADVTILADKPAAANV